MSLGVVIGSHQGFAIGADSLVSQVSHVLPLDDFKYPNPEKEENPVEAILEAIRENASESVQNNHRSSKITPVFYVNDRPMGCRVHAGNGYVNRVQDQVLETVDFPVCDTFEQWINMFFQATGKIMKSEKFERQMRAEHFYAAHCPGDKKYELCRAIIEIDRGPDGNQQMSAEFENRSDNIISTIGDDAIVEQIVYGASNRAAHVAQRSLYAVAEAHIRAVAGGEKPDMNRTLLQAGKTCLLVAEELGLNLHAVLMDIQSTKSFNPQTDSMSVSDFTSLIHKIAIAYYAESVRGGRGLDHLSTMSLRELIRVVEYLIGSTIKFHEYLQTSIPTVGGDIYYATISRRDGFVFRKPGDMF